MARRAVFYSHREYYEMVRCYILSGENAVAAQRLYVSESVPRLEKQGLRNINVPSVSTITAANQRLLDHGQFTAPSKSLSLKLTVDDDEEGDEESEEGEESEEWEGSDAEDQKGLNSNTKKTKLVIKKKKKETEENEEGIEEEDEAEGEEEEEEEEEEQEEAEPRQSKPTKRPLEPPLTIPAGKGVPLLRISNVEVSLARFELHDLKMLHQFLYGQLCLDRNVKRNVKKFKGYPWDLGSSEHKAKLEAATKMEPQQLRTVAELLDLDKTGSQSELAQRIVGYLQQPGPNSPFARGSVKPRAAPPASTPGGRPRRSAAVKVHNRGYADEDSEKDGSEDSDNEYRPAAGNGRKDSSDEESDGPADKMGKRPPTDKEIKNYVKHILKDANLEEVTLKTVIKQVYSHYPDFDLAHKKAFIKETVISSI